MTKQYQPPEPAPAPDIEATPKRDRPFALKVVCALLMLEGILLLIVVAALTLTLLNPTADVPFSSTFEHVLVGFGRVTEMIILGTGGAVLIWVALGLWRLDPWAWRWTMVAIGVLLIINLYNYLGSDGNLQSTIALLIDILIVFYLVQPEVRRLYIDKPQNEVLPNTP